jgi:hypothetical protein
MSSIIETLLHVVVKLNKRRSSYVRKRPVTMTTAAAYSHQQQASVAIGLSIVLTFITIFLCTLIRTQNLLNDYLDESSRTGGACMEISNVLSSFPNNQNRRLRTADRFIIFQPIMEGQGTGNIMSGLLAVHLLGLEFNRTVCVSQSYTNFHMAFEIANPAVAVSCRQLLECEQPVFKMQHHIRLINYMAAPNECSLQAKLASTLEDDRILWIMANTYPRWPQDDMIPNDFFFHNYQARKRLIDMLPYDVENPPSTVVHLRFQDGSRDIRKGLDNTTLHNLGKSLSLSTTKKNDQRPVYLVSNHVAFFDFFEREYGWEHPIWDAVTHSALAISWGNRHNESIRRSIIHDTKAERDKQTMQLWVDWYTLLRAKYIVHTASDFSSSAAHWMKINSMIIEGSSSEDDNNDNDDEVIRLSFEFWRRNNDAISLVERTNSSNDAAALLSVVGTTTTTRQLILQRCNEDPTLNGAMTVSIATFLTAPKLKIKKQPR